MNSYKENFWKKLDEFIASGNVIIDRPKGSPHPRFPQMIYPLDYGYLDNATGGDGDGLDLWRGDSGSLKLDAVLCSVDSVKKDAELKLLLGCTDEEKKTILAFHNNSSLMAAFMIER